MRSIEDQMKEILRRKNDYLVLKQFKHLRAISIGLGCVLIAALFLLPGMAYNMNGPLRTNIGVTILGPETGGYVIVALLAFGLGILATLASQKRRKMNQSRTDAEGKEQKQ